MNAWRTNAHKANEAHVRKKLGGVYPEELLQTCAYMMANVITTATLGYIPHPQDQVRHTHDMVAFLWGGLAGLRDDGVPVEQLPGRGDEDEGDETL